jgi:hypothetical protein
MRSLNLLFSEAYRPPFVFEEEKVGKQQDKPNATPDKLFVFGVDGEGKPRGARFSDFNERALKFALDLGLVGVYPASPAFTELAVKLPPGRLYSSGKGFIPNVRKDLVEKLNLALATAGDESQQHRPPPRDIVASPASGLPKSWDDIGVGQLVLATGDEPDDGYWECIVLKRQDNVLTLRLRDYPKQGTYVRHLAQVALLNPGI